MIKPRSMLSQKKRKIDLTQPEGNAYVLLEVASKLCEQTGRDFNKIRSEMISGDYENLLKVFDREFSKYVTLYR
jgi:hypothetical protein